MSTGHLMNGKSLKKSPTPASASKPEPQSIGRSQSVRTSTSSGATEGKNGEGKKPLLSKILRGHHTKSQSLSAHDSTKSSVRREEYERVGRHDVMENDVTHGSSGNDFLEEAFATSAEPMSRLNPALEIFKTHFNDERIAVFIDLLARDRPDLKHELEIMMLLLNKDGQGHLAAGDHYLPAHDDSRSKEQVVIDLLRQLKRYKEIVKDYKAAITRKSAEVAKERERSLEFKGLMIEHSDLIKIYQQQKAERTRHLAALNKCIGDMQTIVAACQTNAQAPYATTLRDAPKYLDELIRTTQSLKLANIQFYEKYFPGEGVGNFGHSSQLNPITREPNDGRPASLTRSHDDDSNGEFFDVNNEPVSPQIAYNQDNATPRYFPPTNPSQQASSQIGNGESSRRGNDGQTGSSRGTGNQEIYELHGQHVCKFNFATIKTYSEEYY